jgi:hypothetical protein
LDVHILGWCVEHRTDLHNKELSVFFKHGF